MTTNLIELISIRFGTVDKLSKIVGMSKTRIELALSKTPSNVCLKARFILLEMLFEGIGRKRILGVGNISWLREKKHSGKAQGPTSWADMEKYSEADPKLAPDAVKFTRSETNQHVKKQFNLVGDGLKWFDEQPPRKRVHKRKPVLGCRVAEEYVLRETAVAAAQLKKLYEIRYENDIEAMSTQTKLPVDILLAAMQDQSQIVKEHVVRAQIILLEVLFNSEREIPGIGTFGWVVHESGNRKDRAPSHPIPLAQLRADFKNNPRLPDPDALDYIDLNMPKVGEAVDAWQNEYDRSNTDMALGKKSLPSLPAPDAVKQEDVPKSADPGVQLSDTMPPMRDTTENIFRQFARLRYIAVEGKDGALLWDNNQYRLDINLMRLYLEALLEQTTAALDAVSRL